MKLVFASSNINKLTEIAKLLPASIQLQSLNDLGINEEIPETSPTIKENALQKARYLNEKYGFNCFADDTGLEVFSLNNEPGVFSARYAGPAKSAEANMNKLLEKLKDSPNRQARFLTVIALILDGKEYIFEGEIKGSITKEKRGSSGFGYDPVFIPEGLNKSFGEMDLDEKNKISHRAIAVNKLCAFLKGHSG
jgi:XTP/dITP diphosphohydrolase